MGIDGREVVCENPAAAFDLAEVAARAGDFDFRIEAERRGRTAFKIRVRIDECAERRDRVRGTVEARGESLQIDIADIIIMRGLTPGPATFLLIEAKDLDIAKLCLHGGVGLGA